jgi:glycosyltransferase involved in cell wall biosynthesis
MLELSVPVRVVHLVTSRNGGAGIAADRLAKLQNKSGTTAVVLGPKSVRQRPLLSIFSKILTFTQMKIATREYEIVTPVSLANLKIEDVDLYKPDLIHIHNWYNLLNESLILELSRKYPLVFTLHDQRLFTGGCHNSFACEGFKVGCVACPATKALDGLIEKSFSRLTNCLRRIEWYALIAPSQWILHSALESGQFSNATSASHVPNILELPKNRIDLKPINESCLKILFVSAQLDIHIKGLELLMASLKGLCADQGTSSPTIQLTVIGDSSRDYAGDFGKLEVSQIARLDSAGIEAQMRLHDLLVVPSLSENSPNVVGEAQLSGLIVAAANVGGVPELIDHKKTGFLFSPSIEEIRRTILEFVKLNQNEINAIRTNANLAARERYDSESILKHTNRIYQELVDQNNA